MITLLRWMGVIVLPPLTGLVIFLFAQLTLQFSHAQCDQSMLVADLCVASWHADVMDTIVYGAIALTAIGFVILPGIIAPAFRRWISLAGLIVICAVSFFIYQRVGWPDLLGAALVVTTASVLGFGYIWFRENTANDN